MLRFAVFACFRLVLLRKPNPTAQKERKTTADFLYVLNKKLPGRKSLRAFGANLFSLPPMRRGAVVLIDLQ